MNKSKIVVSKTLKVPIQGISFSNKQPSITIEYEPQEFDIVKASDEINQWLNILLENDPSWMQDKYYDNSKSKKTV